MMQIEPGGNLQLDVPQMDREHFELIAQGSEFASAVDRQASRAELEVRLTQLIESFQHHFDSEEGLMRSNNFPGLQSHVDEHRKLLGQMSGLRDDLGAGVVNRCHALVQFVQLWTEHHITGADALFARFLHGKDTP